MILKRNLATRQILNWKGNNASQFDLKENNASDFELNKYSASEFELKETTRQILNLRKPKASEFELKLLLHVRFGIGKKTNLWILNLDFYYMSDSELKSYNALDFLMKFSLHVRYFFEKKTLQFLNLRFPRCRIWKKFAYKRITLPSLLREYDNFCVSCDLNSIIFLKKIPTTRQILEWKEYNASKFELKENNASDSDLKVLQLVRFWIENFTKCQILNWRKTQRVRFWIERSYSSDFEI